ncbi:hypothetical protein [Salipiger abyssi]|uniref:YVTN family beta-propeller repeat protein n=1 Tax=Salipiger abyssi TaxID=1250539 RepID=A0A1P8UR03_9RHOB|nr:hypothetical protein [Salipiger abyssi]APZ51821.1 YVTN family beta-propeller repeat protein [Salipiger abyssi]
MSLPSVLRSGVCAAATAVALIATPALSDPFADLARGFDAQLRAAGAERAPIAAGGVALITGRGFTPGQSVTFRQGGTALNDGAAVEADDKGEISAEIAIPEGTAPGIYPVVAEVSGPDYATTFEIKVSPVLAPSGDFATESQPLEPGLYQVAATDEAVYVTSAVGRPPVKQSALMKLDPETLEIVAQTAPGAAPARADGSDGGVFAVYGIGVAEEAGQVWVTNTRQDTVAVYDADDLSLIKQFPSGTVSHSRDAVAHDGKVYVTATFEPFVHVFDTETLEETGTIELRSSRRRAEFGTASLQLDEESGTLYVVSLGTNEVAAIDLASGEQTGVWPVDLSRGTIGVGHDAETGRIFTAGQGSDNVMILDDETGEVLHEVMVGANPLNIVFDPEADLAYVTLRGSGTLVAVTPDGEIAGNIEIGSFPNHLALDGKGGVLVVNKSKGADDPTGDHITRVTPEG